MGHESRCSRSHLKCHILGIKDRSVRTLIRLWLTLPCGRGWKGLSQEIGIHKGACVRQCWTGLLKPSVTVFTTFIAAVIRRYLSSDSKHSQCLKHNHRAVRIKAFFPVGAFQKCWGFKISFWLDNKHSTEEFLKPFLKNCKAESYILLPSLREHLARWKKCSHCLFIRHFDALI